MICETDYRVVNYPLTSSPMFIIGLIIVYVYFVTDLGQKYMKSRPAYDLSNTIKIYNVIQIFMNLFIGGYVSIDIGIQAEFWIIAFRALWA